MHTWMHICVFECIFRLTYVYINEYIHIHIHIYLYTRTPPCVLTFGFMCHAYVYLVYTYVHPYVYVFCVSLDARVYAYVCLYVQVNMYICICTYVYMYICINMCVYRNAPLKAAFLEPVLSGEAARINGFMIGSQSQTQIGIPDRAHIYPFNKVTLRLTSLRYPATLGFDLRVPWTSKVIYPLFGPSEYQQIHGSSSKLMVYGS